MSEPTPKQIDWMRVARHVQLGTVTCCAMATVCFLAWNHSLTDGETIAGLSAAMSAFVGAHAVNRPGSNPP